MTEGGLDGAEVVRRLAAAGVVVPRAESVVVDFASDPPLSRSLSTTAIEEAARIVEGAGAAMLASRARRSVIAVRDAAAHKAIASALKAAGAKTLTVTRAPDVWPTVGLDRDLDCKYAWILDGERLLDVEAAALGRSRAARRVTVAGHVAKPGVFALQQERTVEELVAAAGGATVEADAWVALDGGAYGGAIADREATVRSALLLVVPASHHLIARARLPIADHLRRAASACEGCRACTEACPVALDGIALQPHGIVASLVVGTDRGTGSAAAAACVGCGVCDAACPGGLSPSVLMGALRARLGTEGLSDVRKRGEPHPDRAGRRMSLELLVMRAGLGEVAGADSI